MHFCELVREYLKKDILIQYTWPDPVDARDEESWIEDTLQAFYELTPDDVEIACKWCNFKGSDDEIAIAAIKSLIIPEDLPIGCLCDIEFIGDDKQCP